MAKCNKCGTEYDDSEKGQTCDVPTAQLLTCTKCGTEKKIKPNQPSGTCAKCGNNQFYVDYEECGGTIQ